MAVWSPAPKPVVRMRAGLAPLVMLLMTALRETPFVPLIRSSMGCRADGIAAVPFITCTQGNTGELREEFRRSMSDDAIDQLCNDRNEERVKGSHDKRRC